MAQPAFSNRLKKTLTSQIQAVLAGASLFANLLLANSNRALPPPLKELFNPCHGR
jgi:hypothetical protein